MRRADRLDRAPGLRFSQYPNDLFLAESTSLHLLLLLSSRTSLMSRPPFGVRPVVYSTVQGERMRPVRWTPSSIARSSFDAASLLTETPRACDGTAAKRVKALRWRSVFAGIRAGANSAKKRSETAHHRWSLLMRDLVRKLPAAITEEQRENFSLCRRVLAQKPHDNEKIYSLHEPHIYCVAKGTGAQET